MQKEGIYIRVHRKEGTLTYRSLEEMPDGIERGFASWMLLTGERFQSAGDFAIEIVEETEKRT